LPIGVEEVEFLTEIGFTRNQAILYLTLLKLEEADVRRLFEETNIPRSEIYRILKELQKKGLVEKKITAPLRYHATPLDLGLQLLISNRIQRCKEVQVKTKKFLRKYQTKKQEALSKQEYHLTMVEGKQRLKQILKPQHDRAQRTIDILTTLPRWLQILHFCFENYEKALARGVRYRILLEAFSGEIGEHENIDTLLKTKNFELRLSKDPLDTNAAIFDQKEAVINFLPSQSLAESPIIRTNHPSFISMCQDHFEAKWKTSTPIKQITHHQLTETQA
jgi:sugar-specific transcriptional regulator TrmB